MRIDTHLYHSWLAIMCLCLCCVSNSLASVDICQGPTADSYLSIAYQKHDKSSFENGRGETRQENYDFDLQFNSNNKWVFGVGHRYTILNVDRLGLQTNGHLHTFFIPLHRLSQAEGKSIRLSIAPALSASSNVMKDPDEYTGDALQLLVALVWNRQVSAQLGFRYGICGDHRFGNYRIYPLVSIDRQLHPDWKMELGFPVTQISYRISKNLVSSLRVAPDGNEWYVGDKDLQEKSKLVYEAYVLEWAFDWRAHEHLSLTASVGIQFDNRYEFTLLDDSRDKVSSESVTRIGAALVWHF
jgi:hypothetical protein